MRKLKLAALAAGLVVAAIPQQASAAAPACGIQANWRAQDGGFYHTAAVNCTSGQMVSCSATAMVVDSTGAVLSDPQATAQGPSECLNSYSTVLTRDTNPGFFPHHVEATFKFEIQGGASQFPDGDTAGWACLLGETDTVYICSASSTPYSP